MSIYLNIYNTTGLTCSCNILKHASTYLDIYYSTLKDLTKALPVYIHTNTFNIKLHDTTIITAYNNKI